MSVRGVPKSRRQIGEPHEGKNVATQARRQDDAFREAMQKNGYVEAPPTAPDPNDCRVIKPMRAATIVFTASMLATGG